MFVPYMLCYPVHLDHESKAASRRSASNFLKASGAQELDGVALPYITIFKTPIVRMKGRRCVDSVNRYKLVITWP